MKLIRPSCEILSPFDSQFILKQIERCGRVCYKSEASITHDSAEKFVKMIIRAGHESVLEHEKVTLKIICDRGVSHEIVRHRMASYSQESTRYCNYSADKFGNELTFIIPCFFPDPSESYELWADSMSRAEETYLKMIQMGVKPEEARAVLPNSLKTELIVTMNFRELRHFLKLRTSPRAHPQMREIAGPLLNAFKEAMPVMFEDIASYTD